jgi:Family of unknown function (DUF6152)
MTKWTLRCFVVCGCLMALMAGVSLQAHHSLAGAYALGKESKITGTFTAFRLVNPHSSLKLEVKNPDGKVVEWAITGGSVTTLARLGIGKDGPNALHVGDEITVTYTPAADGKSPIGLLVAITYSDGHTVRFRSPDE